MKAFSLIVLACCLSVGLAAHSQLPAPTPSSVVAATMADIDPYRIPLLQRVALTGQLSTRGNSDFRRLRDLAFQVEEVDLSAAECSEIPDNAFHSRRNLRHVVLPRGVKKIGEQAFYGCRNLERIVIPASVDSIGQAAFNGCSSLREVVFEGTPKFVGELAFNLVPVSGIRQRETAVPAAPRQAALVPLPNEWRLLGGKSLLLSRVGRIVAPADLHNEAAHLRRVLRERSGIEVLRGKAELRLAIDSTLASPEAYVLDIDAKGLRLRGGSAAGVFYGVMTIEQLLVFNAQELAAQHIADAPRLAIREFMLDPCRTFIPFEELKNFVKEMARYKMNALHLHLVDDQAWRVEIKAFPRLTALSSLRPSMDDMLYSSPGFYTQDELRELVAFAAKYHVEVIPEIEMPGHQTAAIHAYPQLTVGAKKVEVRTTSGVSNELLNPAGDFTYEFLFKVFDELAEVFPSRYVHLGGDEAGMPPLANWTADSACQSLLTKIGGTAHDGSQNWKLQQYLFDRVIAHLRDKLKKTPMFWYETDFHDIQPGCVIFAWRHGLTNAALDAAERCQSKVMLCPGEHCYIDYPMAQGDLPEVNWGMPIISLRQTYELNPNWGRSEAFEREHVLGVAGPLWSECIPTPERIYYQAFPRGLALAELTWTQQARRDYEGFRERASQILYDMQRRGLTASRKF